MLSTNRNKLRAKRRDLLWLNTLKSIENPLLVEKHIKEKLKLDETKKIMRKFKNLYETYYKMKQFHSIKKICNYIDNVVNLNLDDTGMTEIYILAIKRTIQVIGETIKATKQTPNISKKLEAIFNLISPKNLLDTSKHLRQFLSHDYSLAKYILNQEKPNVDDFKRIQENLKTARDLFSFILNMQNLNFYKKYLARLLRLESVKKMQNYIKFIGTAFKSSLIYEHVPYELEDSLVCIKNLQKNGFQKEMELKIVEKGVQEMIGSIKNAGNSVSKTVNEYYFLETCFIHGGNVKRTKEIIREILQSTRLEKRYFVVHKDKFMPEISRKVYYMIFVFWMLKRFFVLNYCV